MRRALMLVTTIALALPTAATATPTPTPTPTGGPAAASLQPAGPLKPLCSLLRHTFPLAVGCSVADHTVSAGAQLAQGNTSAAVGTVVGGAASDVASLALSGFADGAAAAAAYALNETAALINSTTSPQLQAPWFQRIYWRLAGIAVVFTLPCLFAAAVQSLMRSDLALLVRATFGYLPVAMLAVGVLAQLVALLLAATDGLCAVVAGAAGDAAPNFLHRAGSAILELSAISRSPFLALVVALFTVSGAVVLWLELLMRDAAVYVVVAMLPLAFAALVWPARRAWALRAVELLAALILAKLAIVTVLTLGGAALTQAPNTAGFLVGLVLLVLGAFSPWAMLRMLPLGDVAGAAAGHLRTEAGLPGGQELRSYARDLATHLSPRRPTRPDDERDREDDTSRSTAESLMAHMNADQPAGSTGGAAAGEATGSGESAPMYGSDSVPIAGFEPTGPRVRNSMFTAPDHGWRALDLTPNDDLRPLWTPPDPEPGPAGAGPEPPPELRAPEPPAGAHADPGHGDAP